MEDAETRSAALIIAAGGTKANSLSRMETLAMPGLVSPGVATSTPLPLCPYPYTNTVWLVSSEQDSQVGTRLD
jgi:hypothetical protein